MSLINKMLKDLEARRKKQSKNKPIAEEQEASTPEIKENKPPESQKKPEATTPETSTKNPEVPSEKPEAKQNLSSEQKEKPKDEKNKSEKQTFRLDGELKPSLKKTNKTLVKNEPEKSSKPKTTPKKKVAFKGPLVFDNQIIPSEKSSWAKYASTIVLLIILAVVIVALVFAAIAFHDRWQRKKKPDAVPATQHKLIKRAQAIASGAQAYKNKNQLNGETKKAVEAVNPELIKKQRAFNKTLREKTNKITASIISQARNKSQIKPPVGTKQSVITVKKSFSKNEQANMSYDQAIKQLNSGSTAQAIAQLNTILNKLPDYKPARVALAATLINQGRNVEAEKTLLAGLQEDPGYSPYAELVAHLLVQNNHIDEALKALKKAQPNSISENPDYFAFMAALYLQQGQYEQSATLYQQLTTFNGKNANWWAGLSISLRKLGQLQKAGQAFQQAKNADNLSPELAAYLQQ
jgi:tetratricopeptide (TPR) repeat protein